MKGLCDDLFAIVIVIECPCDHLWAGYFCILLVLGLQLPA